MAEEYDLNTDELIGNQRVLSLTQLHKIYIINYNKGDVYVSFEIFVLFSSKVAS